VRHGSIGSLRDRLSRSILFHLLCFLSVVILYNRLVFGLHSISARDDFSTWAAPLYAVSMPIPSLTCEVIARWSVPVLVAGLWVWIVMRWTAETYRTTARNDSSIVAADTSPRKDRGLASPATMVSVPPHAPVRSLSSQLRIALGFILLLNLTTCMMDSGLKSISWPFSRTGEEYFGDAMHLGDPMQLLREYPTMRLSHHPATHPPGGVLLLWVVRKTLGEGLMTASLVAIVLTALTIIPAAMLARRFLSPGALTIFIGLYVLTPNLVLFGATSMDGVFALFLVCAACVFFRGAKDTASLRLTILRGIHLGLWLALSTFFTYATIALVALLVVWWMLTKFSPRIFAILSIAALTLVASFAILCLATSCNIIACARTAIAFDAQTMNEVKVHYWDVSVTNLLGFLVGSGMIAATLWMRSLRGRSDVNALSRALAMTLMLLSFSTLFTRELERVWMFLTPLLLVSAAWELDRLSKKLRRRWIVGTMVLLFVQTWVTQVMLNTIW
jgi:hypothetical protein